MKNYKITHNIISYKDGKVSGSLGNLTDKDAEIIISEKEEMGYTLKENEINIFDTIAKMKNPMNCKHGDIDYHAEIFYCNLKFGDYINRDMCEFCSDWKIV